MKIVKYKGGLGNQMFQYAFGKLMKEKYGEEVFADFSSYEKYDDTGIRVPRILKFQTDITFIDKDILQQVLLFKHGGNASAKMQKFRIGVEGIFNKCYYFETDRKWRNPENLLKYTYLDGYWQNWKYVTEMENPLRSEFVLKNNVGEKTRVSIEHCSKINSVMLGIRRGDYLQDKKHFGDFDIRYYHKCMDYIASKVEKPVFVVFSNDIEWVKNHMDFTKYDIVYRLKADQDSDLEELMVMAACKHFIIVNSTYQWWGAWLAANPNKIILAPKDWFADDKAIDIVPPSWIKV